MMNAGIRKFTVPALHEEVDRLLASRYPSILVEAEVGQLQQPSSGHCYLQLRDRGGSKNQDCTLSAMVWRDDWARLRFRPGVGDRVICRGRLAMYAPRGNLQLYVTDIAPAGLGALAQEIEARKARLMAEGLLDPRRKRSLPVAPRVVGVATSLTGAALQDFLKVSRERYPPGRILVAPCLVQGQEAPASVVRAIDLLLEDGRCEIIVVTRGGGSKEDLLAFQDEVLARCIAASPVPVVSAVGHQIDTTIADLVADAVAPTPSAAAMLVFPDGRALARRLDESESALAVAMSTQLKRRKERVDSLSVRLRHPGQRLVERRRQWQVLHTRALLAIQHRIRDRRHAYLSLQGRLEALSPLHVLDRGYAIVRGPHGVVRSMGSVQAGEALEIRLADGSISAVVVPPAEQGQLTMW
jgi:exodeoxyribonuclease VII large subunit